jgi:hypothetical protein
VDKNDEPFQWGPVDVDGLKEFLTEKMGWDAHYVGSYVAPTVKRQQERRLQPTLSAYFAPALRGQKAATDAQAAARASMLDAKEEAEAVAPLPLGDDVDALLFGTARTRAAVAKLRSNGGDDAGGGAGQASEETKLGGAPQRSAGRGGHKRRRGSAVRQGSGRRSGGGTTAGKRRAGAAVAAAAQAESKGSAFAHWYAVHRDGIALEAPHMSAAEVALEAERRWRSIPSDEKERWLRRAEAATVGASGEKVAEVAPPAKRVKEREILDADVFMERLQPTAVEGDTVRRGTLGPWVSLPFFSCLVGIFQPP